MSRPPLLLLQQVERRFPSDAGETVVLCDVGLAIAAGEMVAIVGASGSGKSTLMNILGCLDRPSAGRYLVDGQDVAMLDADALAQLRRERFGFIFQRYHLMPHLSAAGNVEVPAAYAGIPAAARHERALHLLDRLGLGGRGASRPGQLSGGQQQRVSIARALMNGGQVILADEPTGALDSRSGEEVMAILRELHAQGHTIVLVTHDRQVAACAERIIEVADGRIVADRTNRPAAPAARAAADRSPPASPPGPGTPPKALPAPPAARLRGGWQRFTEAFLMAWRSILAHRLRSALTMLGIVIGITSVVAITAIGEGAKRYVLDDIRAIGTNTLEIYPGADFGDDRADSIRTMVAADLDALRALPYVDSVTPLTTRTLRLRHRNVDVNGAVHGVSESLFRVRGMRLADGSGFRSEDVLRHAQVVAIDENTRRKLFGRQGQAIGKIILVGNLPCTVVAVLRERKSMFDDNKSLNVWLPYSTAGSRLFGQQHFEGLAVRIAEGQPGKAAEQGVVRLLAQRHGKKDFFTFNLDSIVKTAERTSQALTLLLSTVAVISLVVGGIGVMNIMLVSVTERTREIGIRMAVGARRGDVMQQFLTEAVLVCLMGGVIGVVLAYGLGLVFALASSRWQMVFSPLSVAGAFLCATLVGVVFGYLPARKAARLTPIEALNRE
ncbi:macrolide ABC transporter permease/ATP-binding protein MacB [Cupriavidus sp. USMAHM13]|uniref:MacB family efflux pump subunit n=1 Tax=Cupriavidus sp. USMAHM13 TaxID=1389192 RepID=UPI0008A6A644|nr:MacB family efflux pump subunit [Cupriavidus sp. USMAHM13]AOZ03085.1 macrolide ABC transporter permease/ATP-binding protein MacB [Cupriavidus sp. USMAHM13]